MNERHNRTGCLINFGLVFRIRYEFFVVAAQSPSENMNESQNPLPQATSSLIGPRPRLDPHRSLFLLVEATITAGRLVAIANMYTISV